MEDKYMRWKGKVLGVLALSLVLQPLAGQAAFADDDITIKVMPGSAIANPVILPEYEVQTEKVITAPVIVEPKTTTTIIEPTTILEKRTVTEPSVVREETIIEKTTSSPVTVESTAPATVSTEVSESARKPLFHARLNNIKEQVDRGVANGWLSSGQASDFRARADALLNEADTHLASMADKTLGDSLERQVNQLNIDVSSSMQPRPAIGSGSQMQ
ncbi:MAG: hypothetical protein K2Z81_02590 [Cyanobacteria bacterium]|nr:hypothetical protein [Cyanobacteriota bacterium]